MIFNVKPMKVTDTDSLTNYLYNQLNDLFAESRMRQLNLSNVTVTRYNGKMKYVPEVLKKSKDSKILSINLNTQFQNDTEINKTVIGFETSIEGRNFEFDNIEIYDQTGIGRTVMACGIPMAEYFPEVNHLNILINFDEIFKQIKKQVTSSQVEYTGIFIKNIIRVMINYIQSIVRIVEFEERNWLNEANREKNVSNLKDKTARIYKAKVKELENQISIDRKKVEEQREYLVNTVKRIEMNERIKDTMAGGDDEMVNKMTREMDSILNNVYIQKVAYTDDLFEFMTNYLPIYDDKQIWEGDCYYVKINMSSSQVTIESLTGKGYKGHWSSNDCHPHVSDVGKPCLGSINQTIVDLVAQQELYVLTVIMVEYLKSVNKSDSAGAKITNSGRKLLSKQEHDELMSYEKEKVTPIEEVVEPLPIEVTPTKKKTKKALAEEVIANAPQVAEPMLTTVDVSSACVHCGVDVYAHGHYQPVVDIRNGAEDYKVACNSCVTSDNGFRSHTSGFPAYQGNGTTGELTGATEAQIIGGTF